MIVEPNCWFSCTEGTVTDGPPTVVPSSSVKVAALIERAVPFDVMTKVRFGENPEPGQLKPPSAVKLIKLGETITNAAAVGAVVMRPTPLSLSHPLAAIAAANTMGNRCVATARR